MPKFRLDKWYFDCVSPDGSVLVGYAARLKWGPVGIDYGARIAKEAGGSPSQRQSLSFGRVDQGDGTISWANDRLKVSGVWAGGESIGSTVVVDEPAGRVEWRCLGANCQVDVRVDGRAMAGTGYVERLSMTIPPWSLPFTELRWGRFISDDRTNHVVWTDMRGGTARNWVWVNSAEPVAGTVDAAGVRTGATELVFLSSDPLRGDDVMRTLMGRLVFLKRLLPKGLRAIREDKQVSRCVLRMDGSESKGSSINEVVAWARA